MAKIVKSYKQRGKVKHVMFSLPEPGAAAEENKMLTYMVRGLTPKEAYTHADIAGSVELPLPPIKQRTRLPAGKLDITDIEQEEYEDLRDPTYLSQLKTFNQEQLQMSQRATIYTLAVCVQGFDLSDAEIKEELDQEPHARAPLDELLLRLDQLYEIIMSDFDQGHLMALRQKIQELSGVSAEQVNFT